MNGALEDITLISQEGTDKGSYLRLFAVKRTSEELIIHWRSTLGCLGGGGPILPVSALRLIPKKCSTCKQHEMT